MPGLADRRQVVLQGVVLARLRHRQVAGQQVEQRRDVGRALDARVPAQRHDPAAGTAHVAEQQLDDRRAADVLHAGRVVRPADRVDPRRRALAAAVGGHRLADLQELVLRNAADLLDDLGGVAGVVALEHLVDAARVLQRLVALDARVLQRGAAAAELVAAVGVLLALLLALGSSGACLLGRGRRTATTRRRTTRSRGRSRRTGRRGPRCRRSPRAGSSPRWCRRRRTRGSRARCRGCSG